MNFFERQAQVKNQSLLLVVLFILALIGIIATCSLVIAVFINLPLSQSLIYSTLIVTFVVFSSTLARIVELRKGGAAVASALGARQLSDQDNTYLLVRLRNVVEEMAIASGTTVPDIYIMEDEDSINAFASGFTTGDAVITVTRGAVDKLNRDELQAVIAHEYSHILNGDMRLNLKLVGVLFGILAISMVGQKILSSRIRGKNAGSIYLMALGIYLVGIIGLFFGKLIKASINRKREYLADACAVQYTRQDQGLVGAFKKIAGISSGSTINNVNGIEFNHMYFCSGFSSWTKWMASHPPLEDRIRAIDPRFNYRELFLLKQQWATKQPNGMEEDIALGFDKQCDKEYIPTKKFTADTKAIIASVGTARVEICDHAQEKLHTIPDLLAKMARNNYAAIPILLALLYPDDLETQSRQDQILKSYFSDTMIKTIHEMHDLIKKMDGSLRLALASLTFPALRNNSPEKLKLLVNNIQALILADNHVSIQDYCLGHMISVQINDFLYPYDNDTDNVSLSTLSDEVSKLLAIIADVGQSANGGMEKSFNEGINHVLPKTKLSFINVESPTTTLDVILPKLNKLSPLAKQTLLESMIITIQTDNVITNNESDLLRLICASLHIPLPLLSNVK